MKLSDTLQESLDYVIMDSYRRERVANIIMSNNVYDGSKFLLANICVVAIPTMLYTEIRDHAISYWMEQGIVNDTEAIIN